MRCEDVRDQLSSHLDGTAPALERHALGAHLSGCGACAEQLAALRRLQAALQTPPVAPPERVWRRLLATLEERRRHPARRAFRRWAPRLGAAAAGVLAALAGLSVLSVGPAAPPTAAIAAEEAYLSDLMTSAASARVGEAEALEVDPPVEGLLASVFSEGRKP